jgi:hypothetical protein
MNHHDRAANLIRSFSQELYEMVAQHTKNPLVPETVLSYAYDLQVNDDFFTKTVDGSAWGLPYLTQTIRSKLVRVILDRLDSGEYPSPLSEPAAWILLAGVNAPRQYTPEQWWSAHGQDIAKSGVELEIIKHCEPASILTYVFGADSSSSSPLTAPHAPEVMHSILDYLLSVHPNFDRHDLDLYSLSSAMDLDLQIIVCNRVPGVACGVVPEPVQDNVLKRLDTECEDPVIAHTLFEDHRFATQAISLDELCEAARALSRSLASNHAH